MVTKMQIEFAGNIVENNIPDDLLVVVIPSDHNTFISKYRKKNGEYEYEFEISKEDAIVMAKNILLAYHVK